MMDDYYGTGHIRFTFISDEFNSITVDQYGNVRPTLPRTFDSFNQAAGENALSRLYLGNHYNFDATAGIKSGDEIADYVFEHSLLPLSGPRPKALPSMNPQRQIQLAVNHETPASRAAYKHMQVEVHRIIAHARVGHGGG